MPSTPVRVAFKRPWPGTRRGFCLWLLSIAIIVLGAVNYVFTDPSPEGLKSLSFALQISQGSVAFWGWTMIGIGLAAGFCSYCHFGRDRYGYIIVCVFTSAWGLGYVTGLFYGAGLRALGGAVIWLLFSGIFIVVAGFPNVRLGHHPPILEPDQHDSGA